MSLQSFNVIYQLFSVGYPGGHLLLQSMTRHDFNAYIGLVLVEEVLKLGHIIEHKGVLAELHFNQHLVFHKINLLECTGDGHIVVGYGDRVCVA